jgi:aquaporin rerated protein, invertebrate
VYTVGQLLGAFLGYGLLRMITPNEFFEGSTGFCVSLPAADTTTAFIVEFIITSVLILVCCGVWDPRNAQHHGELLSLVPLNSQLIDFMTDSVPLRFGLAVMCLALVGVSRLNYSFPLSHCNS